LKVLAERHGWPLRTVYRDIEALELAGYPVIREDGRFRLEAAGPNLDGVPSPEERLALYLARESARAWKQTSLGRALDRLWNRVSAAGTSQASLFPREATPWITIAERGSVDYGRVPHIVATVERAVRDRKALQARYRALSTGQITSRVIEPGQLHHDPALESLYLTGWCRLRNDVRIFAVHRFVAVTALDELCPPRAETRTQRVLDRAFRVWRSTHVEHVRIWFRADAADLARERKWLPGQRVEDHKDGSLILTGEVAGLVEVERWLLGFGERARALEPESLVQSMTRRLRAAAAAYQMHRRDGAEDSLSTAGKAAT
jgi:proteasome accessory factor B